MKNCRIDSGNTGLHGTVAIDRRKQHFRIDGSVIAKFHYTGPTGPDRTHTDPHGLSCDPGLRETPLGPCGSGRARVVEFSYYCARIFVASLAWRPCGADRKQSMDTNNDSAMK